MIDYTEKTYQVQGSVVRVTPDPNTVNGWSCAVQTPTFYVVAISALEASWKAESVLNPHKHVDPAEIYFTIYCEATGEYLDSEKI